MMRKKEKVVKKAKVKEKMMNDKYLYQIFCVCGSKIYAREFAKDNDVKIIVNITYVGILSNNE